MREFTHHNQPYGTVVFAVESCEPVQAPEPLLIGTEFLARRAAAGWVQLRGTVVRGSETMRDLAGRPYCLQVPPEACAAGVYTTGPW